MVGETFTPLITVRRTQGEWSNTWQARPERYTRPILLANATTRITAVDGLATSAAGEIFVDEEYGGVQAFSATSAGIMAPSRWILGAYEREVGILTIGTANSVAVDSLNNLYSRSKQSRAMS